MIVGAACAPSVPTGGPPPSAPVPAPPAGAMPEAPLLGIEEASGVIRLGDHLLIVGDDEPGTYYRVPLAGVTPPRLPLEPSTLRPVRVANAEQVTDLEAVDVLADGRIVLLSEDLRALVDAEGVVARYDEGWSELGGRGLEGLAVRPGPEGGSRVAVVWEGGYLSARRLPPETREQLARSARRPRVLVHDLAAGERDVTVDPRAATTIDLQPPRPRGEEPTAQRFRCPDLVWHRWSIDGEEQWGFLALLSSQWGEEPEAGSDAECPRRVNGEPLRYCYLWLQRFTIDGRPFGDPLDLDPFFPEATRHSNWEGLGWFVPGESVVLVYDERLARRKLDPQEALVVPLPPGW
jgi:hypothetical protein